MALSITEMNYLQQGVVRPLENTLFDLVTTMAKRHSQYLKNNRKDTTDNPEATSCLQKQDAIINQIFSNSSNTLMGLHTQIILALGNLTTFSDLRNYSITQWESFLETNMGEAFDNVADITPAERNAYNAL